jgi:glycine hydroxymethyltransferase
MQTHKSPQVADLLHAVVELCNEVQTSTGAKLIKDFAAALEGHAGVADIRGRVEAFAASFPMPGFAVGHLQ